MERGVCFVAIVTALAALTVILKIVVVGTVTSSLCIASATAMAVGAATPDAASLTLSMVLSPFVLFMLLLLMMMLLLLTVLVVLTRRRSSVGGCCAGPLLLVV